MKPLVLVCTSESMGTAVAMPFLAALEVVGAEIRALDLGRVSVDEGSTLTRFVNAFRSEFGERRLARELLQTQPDVAVAFDPGSCALLEESRNSYPRPFPIAAIVGEIFVGRGWARTSADRYLCVDDQSAYELAELGIPGDRIVPVGVFGECAFVQVVSSDRLGLRRKFKLSAASPVVLVDVAGVEAHTVSQLAMQLSLVKTRSVYLFDAGQDRDVAEVLRRSVPSLDIEAKLFGQTQDEAQLWRVADVLVTHASHRSVARGLQLGTTMVVMEGRGPDRTLVDQLLARAPANRVASIVDLSSVLEKVLASMRAVATEVADGAAIAAEAVWLMGTQRKALMDERVQLRDATRRAQVEEVRAAVRSAQHAKAPAGDLEELSGPTRSAPSSARSTFPDVETLLAELRTQKKQAESTLRDSQRAAAEWDKRKAVAARANNPAMITQANRGADMERARMHSALAQLAQLAEDEKKLKQARLQLDPSGSTQHTSPGNAAAPADREVAPDIDAELEALKRRAGARAVSAAATLKVPVVSPVEAELAAMKRKLNRKK